MCFKISDRTVKKVEQKLEERGYIPNMAATLLARNNSRIIGVIVNDHPKYEGHTFEDLFISAAINHLSDEIELCGYFMMLKKAKKISEIVRFASMWNLDGVVIIGFCEDEYQDLRDHIRVPFVIYDGFADVQNRFGNITIDDFDGGRQVGEYLKSMGHNQVLCIADNDVCMDLMRYKGLCEGLNLKAHTAIFAVSDYYAIELMRFLRRHGIIIPDEISIVGFDGSREASDITPKLTTVAQNNLLRAQTAISLLVKMINNNEATENLCIPVKLLIGESVKELN